MSQTRLSLCAVVALMVTGALLYVWATRSVPLPVSGPVQKAPAPITIGDTPKEDASIRDSTQKSRPEPEHRTPQRESELVAALEAFILSDAETKGRYDTGNPVSSVPPDLREKLNSLPPSVQKIFELASYLPNRPIESLTPETSLPVAPDRPDAATLLEQLTAFVESDPETAKRIEEQRPVAVISPELREKLQAMPPDVRRLFEIAQYLPNRSLTESAHTRSSE